MADKKIKLFIADDHQILLDGLLTMFKGVDKIDVVGTASNGEEVLRELATMKVEVLLMDIQMPVKDGYATAKVVKEKFPEIRIIILSMHNEKIYIERMYSAGIDGYLLKSAGKEEIIQAIEKVSKGEKYFSSEVTAAILEQKTNSSTSITSSELTKREKEILSHIASGLTNPEIAEKLFLSPATIKTHRKNIMRKLDVNNTASLVKYALEHSSTLRRDGSMDA